jgi:hypothetical protein
MSDTSIPEVDPGSVTAPVDNAAFARIRVENSALKTEAAALKTRLDALEAERKAAQDAELSEIDLLKKQVAELSPLRDTHGKFVSQFEAMIAQELSTVPDTVRGSIEKIASLGSDPAARLQAVRDAKNLLTSQPPAPTPAGSTTSVSASKKAAETGTAKAGHELTWGEVFK